MSIFIRSLIALALICYGRAEASAAQISVEPILLELDAPSAAGTLRLHNSDDTPVTIQTRVMHWVQTGTKESLETAEAVVASPPSIVLKPRADTVVRVVRLSKQAVVAEESYRVYVDQLPDPSTQGVKAINLLVRQSIPVFFRTGQPLAANVAWTLVRDGKGMAIQATNSGDLHMRIAALKLKDAGGRTVLFGNGLVGYVLGHSTMQWPLPKMPSGFGAGGVIAVSAQTDKGPINAIAK